jgi:HAMP domain-containing protein
MTREGRPAQPTPEERNDQSPEDVVACRQRALDQQLPAAAFPAGSRVPSLVYLWATMFLAAATILGFALNHQRGVPQAVVDSQRDNVSNLAASIRLTTQRSIVDLDRQVAARSPATPDPELVKQVVGDGTTWNGAAIVETASRRQLAGHGAGLPLDQLPPALPANGTFPINTADGPSLVRSIPLDASRTLLATRPLTVDNMRLNPEARQGIFLITPDGKSTLMQGVSAVDEVHLPAVFRGLAATESSSHPITVTEWPDQQLVVASAPVDETGVKVGSLIVADVAGGISTARGVLLGLTLLAMAVPSFLLMRVSLARPVRRLLKQAKADACGGVPPARKPLGVAEAYRISRALALTSGRTSPSSRDGPRRWRPTVIQGLTAATVVALLWPAAAVATALGGPEPSTPSQLVRDQESRAEAASSVLGNALDNGLRAVSVVSESVDPADPAKTAPLLEQEADHERFRGVYLVDANGKVIASGGRESLRTPQPLPGEVGIDLDDSVSRLPVVYAFRAAKGLAVVGEFDVDYLLGLVRRVDGHARVVDANMRTVLDSEGFRAFQELRGVAREAATAALPGGTVGRSKTDGGAPALIAAAGLTKPRNVAGLKWSVVVEQDVAGLRLPGIFGQRWTLLVAGAAVGTVLLTYVWQYYIFVRPLRRLANAADKIGNGSFETPIPPQRHDDIGAVAMCLEICRQVRHTGPGRLGGVIRLHTEDACAPESLEETTANEAARSAGDRADRRPA